MKDGYAYRHTDTYTYTCFYFSRRKGFVLGAQTDGKLLVISGVDNVDGLL
jgi:hypothetical protein